MLDIINFLNTPSQGRDVVILVAITLVSLFVVRRFMRWLDKPTNKEQYNKFTSNDLNHKVANQKERND